MKLETKHLSYAHGFVGITKLDDDDIDCGRIQSDGSSTCRWPRILGDEPDWFESEVDEMCKLVKSYSEEIHRGYLDYIAQMNADYLRGKGAK